MSSGWLCIENISLAAVADGLGTGIVSYWGDAKKQVGKVLGIPEDHELVCALKIGVPDRFAKEVKEKIKLDVRADDWE